MVDIITTANSGCQVARQRRGEWAVLITTNFLGLPFEPLLPLHSPLLNMTTRPTTVKGSVHWHEHELFCQQVQSFHDNVCLKYPPRLKKVDAKRQCAFVMRKIQSNLVAGPLDLKFTKWYLHGVDFVSFRNCAIGFDVIILLDKGEEMEKLMCSSKSVTSRLKIKDEFRRSSKYSCLKTQHGYLSTDKVTTKLYEQLEDTLGSLDIQDSTRLRYQNGSLFLDVNNPSSGSLWFSACLIPSFRVDKEIYTSKPYTGFGRCNITKRQGRSGYTCTYFSSIGDKDNAIWRPIFIEKEKRFMRCSKDSSHKKAIIRLLKHLIMTEHLLQPLQMHCAKHVLFKLCHEKPHLIWDKKSMGIRFYDVIKEFGSILDKGWLPNFFEKNENILEIYDPSSLNNIANRLENMLHDKEELYRVLNGPLCTAVWHQDSALNNQLRDFHDRLARFPAKQDICEARTYHDRLIKQIQNYFDEVSGIQYQGSMYEGVKISSTDLEFDNMFVFKSRGCMEKITRDIPTGFCQLRVMDYKEQYLHDMTNDDDLLLPQKMMEWFNKNIIQILETLGIYDDIDVYMNHGSVSVELTVYNPSEADLPNRTPWYDVDLVPAFEVDGETVVAKSCPTVIYGNRNERKGKGKKTYASSLTGERNTWRISRAKDEKTILKHADDLDNGCRKMCLRILKVIIDVDPPLRHIKSYAMKTALLALMQNTQLTWDEEDLGLRVMDMLKSIYISLSRGILPSYFYGDGVNILDNVGPRALGTMTSRIKNLVLYRAKMEKLLESPDDGSDTESDSDYW